MKLRKRLSSVVNLMCCSCIYAPSVTVFINVIIFTCSCYNLDVLIRVLVAYLIRKR